MTDITDQPNKSSDIEGRPLRVHRRQPKERQRQSERRERMRDVGAPETHRVNSAISEGLSFAIAFHRLEVTFTPELRRFAAMIGASATTALVERRHCDPDASKAAVLKQMRCRADHAAGAVLRLPLKKV